MSPIPIPQKGDTYEAYMSPLFVLTRSLAGWITADAHSGDSLGPHWQPLPYFHSAAMARMRFVRASRSRRSIFSMSEWA